MDSEETTRRDDFDEDLSLAHHLRTTWREDDDEHLPFSMLSPIIFRKEGARSGVAGKAGVGEGPVEAEGRVEGPGDAEGGEEGSGDEGEGEGGAGGGAEGGEEGVGRQEGEGPEYDDDEEDSSYYDSDVDPEYLVGKCEVSRCNEEVFTACEICEIFLCFDHTNEDINSCREHGKILRKMQKQARIAQQKKLTKDKTPTTPEQLKSPNNRSDERKAHSEPDKAGDNKRKETVDQAPMSERKRKSKLHRDEDMKKKKKAKEKLKYSVKAGCGSGCRRKIKCSAAVSQEEMMQINERYLNMSYQAKKEFIVQSVMREECKRRITKSAKTKAWTYQYTLLKSNGERVQVCKTFFLATLGLGPKNDWIISNLSKTGEGTFPDDYHFNDNRGKHSHYKYTHEDVVAHIESYQPTVAHYRSAHAPNRRYLPSEVTVVTMYTDFKDKYNSKMSYSSFYKIFKSMNISMALLGHEECEVCEKHEIHKKSCQCEELCDISTYIEHKKKYRRAREEYKKDSKSKDTDRLFISANLQKVMMLPRMDSFKAAIFTRRLTVFNETFAELGSGNRDFAAVWHEAIAGRQDKDIASTFYAFLLKVRDIKNIILWLDNCGAQNKNWCLSTMLTHIVNSSKTMTESIQLKYFEKGHTYMSADAKHKEIEKQMKSLGKVYDFDDFLTCIKKSKCEPLEMGTNDGTLAFREWKSGMSQHSLRKLEQRPYLDKMVSVRFTRGSNKLEYKTNFNSNFVELDFLLSAFQLKEEPQKATPRGIPSTKKQDIIKNLVPLMPYNRHAFWNNLSESKVKDLSVQYEKRVSR